MRGSSGAGVPRSASRLIAAAPTAVRQSTRASCTSSASSAVCAWVPLMNASPSFGREPERREPGGRERRRRPAPRRSRPSTSPSPISASAMWLSGARSPLAPTLPCSGTSGHDAGVEQRHERVHQLRAHAAGGTEQHVGAEQHDARAPPSAGSGAPDAGGVAPDQVGLELVELVGRDPDVGQLAEAGVDPVDRLPRRDRGLDQAPAAEQLRRAPPESTPTRTAGVPGDAHHVRDRERAAVERAGCWRHGPK